jgi:hypothetical protein
MRRHILAAAMLLAAAFGAAAPAVAMASSVVQSGECRAVQCL